MEIPEHSAGTPEHEIWFETDLDYALRYMKPQAAHQRPTLRQHLEIGQSGHLARWPAFLMDLVPNGHNRLHWLAHLGLRARDDGPHWDWLLLCYGAANVPGNLRIRESVRENAPQRISGHQQQIPLHNAEHPGFTPQEIAGRGETFVEYATQNHAWASGGSDVQGQAAKFLAIRDHKDRFHVLGARPIEDTQDYWLVKFPRGRREADRKVLAQEQIYLEVAREFGLRCGHPTVHVAPGALFVPRFDRHIVNGEIVQHGMESLYSLCGVNQFGAALSHEEAVQALIQYASPCGFGAAEFIEYVRRDLLNLVMGNTDNHGRNTQLLKSPEGALTLSPVFDFAPMYLDPEGIPRAMRWSDEREIAGVPQWPEVVAWIEQQLGDIGLRTQLKRDGQWLSQLATRLPQLGVDTSIAARAAERAATHIMLLKEL